MRSLTRKSRSMRKAPREYLSWSQFALFQRSQKAYRDIYIYGNNYGSEAMRWGSKFALHREIGIGGDSEMEFAATFMPQYPLREHRMTARIKTSRGLCTILGIADGVDRRRNILADDKTGKTRWTQALVDKNKQLTWNAYLYYLNYGRIPKLELNWYDTGTKKVYTFRTTRTKADFVRLHAEIDKVWDGILRLMAREYARIEGRV